ncbi:HigA family addiction module antitoxin [Pseudoroseomonas sp. WGS1072]|uniref:HigA family addiction module antitoxin n=1 Tax=Roseomonas sp. WGS1072 TaxID=3366816 RepID=UPI003BF08952
MPTSADLLPPITPGEILREEFLEPLGLSARALSKAMGVPLSRLSMILSGKRAITAETAILLGRHFGNSAEFWMNLQTHHDLEVARDRMGVAAAA